MKKVWSVVVLFVVLISVSVSVSGKKQLSASASATDIDDGVSSSYSGSSADSSNESSADSSDEISNESANEDARDSTTDIIGTVKASDYLKAVVYNLPKNCKERIETGTFDALKAEKYDCMFVDSKISATILAILIQKGETELVESIIRLWIQESGWGPLNQEKIAKDLNGLLSVKNVVHAGKKQKIFIENQTILNVFKMAVDVGSGLIVKEYFNYKLIVPNVLNLSFKLDKSDFDRKKTLNLIMETFFGYPNESTAAAGADKIDNNLKSKVHLITLTLNELAKKKKIQRKVWDSYAPLICSEFESKYSIKFEMIEKSSKKKKNLKGNSDSENETDAESLKLIQICDKDCGSVKLKSKVKKSSASTKTSSSPTGENGAITTASTDTINKTNLGMIIGGSVLLISAVGYGIYLIVNKKRRLSKTSSDEL